MYWIETGSVLVGDLGELTQTVDSQHGAKTVIVHEPGLDISLVRRFRQTELRHDVAIDSAVNQDHRLRTWTEAGQDAERVLGFWGNGGLADLAEEVHKMGYDWVYFLLMADQGTRLVYEVYGSYIPECVEMD